MPQQPNVIDIPGVGVIDFGALSPEDTRVAAKRLYDEANVPKQPAALPTKAARAEDFIRPEDRNIFNQDISRSITEGVGGLYSGGKKMAMGLYDVIADPIKKGYAEGSPAATAEAYLKVPGELLEGATASRLALQDKAKTAKSFPERAAYTVLGKVPFLGPAVAGIGEQLGTGNAETMGEGVFNALAALQASPSFRAMTLEGKSAAIEAIKNRASRIPVPAPVKSTLGNMLENPGLTLSSAIIGYKEFGAPGAVLGAMGVPSSIGSLRGMFRETPAEIAEKRAYREGRVKDSRAYAETQTKERNLRQDMNAATKRQETLADRVEKSTTTQEKEIRKQAQADAKLIEGREYKEAQSARQQLQKQEDAALSQSLKEAERLSREAKSAVLRAEASAEAKTLRGEKEALTERHRAENRANTVSDTADRYARQDKLEADHVAAQDLRRHERGLEKLATAETKQAVRDAKDLNDYYIQLAKNLSANEKAALAIKNAEVAAARERALMSGLEPGEPSIVRQSSTVRDGVTTTTRQPFRTPMEVEISGDVMEGAPTGAKTVAPASAGTAASSAPDVLETLRKRADAEKPSWESNELRDIASEFEQLSRKGILTPKESARFEILKNRIALSARELGLSKAAAGSEVNMGVNPNTGTRAYDARRVAGRKGR